MIVKLIVIVLKTISLVINIILFIACFLLGFYVPTEYSNQFFINSFCKILNTTNVRYPKQNMLMLNFFVFILIINVRY